MRSICLAISFLFMSASALTAQKRIVMESSADEFVTLWDNTTAKYSNYETKDEEDKIRDLIVRLMAAVDAHELDPIKQLQEELTEATADFAARRMDRAIAEALSGKNVDDI